MNLIGFLIIFPYRTKCLYSPTLQKSECKSMSEKAAFCCLPSTVAKRKALLRVSKHKNIMWNLIYFSGATQVLTKITSRKNYQIKNLITFYHL